MPIYTEPVSNENILRNIRKSIEPKDVLILGCGTCANISCNIYHGKTEPAYNLLMQPLSLDKENRKLKQLLEENNYIVHTQIINGLCHVTKKKINKMIGYAKDKDTVIVMSCPGGMETAHKNLENKNIVSGMSVKGFKSVKMKLKAAKVFVQE